MNHLKIQLKHFDMGPTSVKDHLDIPAHNHRVLCDPMFRCVPLWRRPIITSIRNLEDLWFQHLDHVANAILLVEEIVQSVYREHEMDGADIHQVQARQLRAEAMIPPTGDHVMLC